MAKTRTEKIEDIKTEIAQLQKRQKELAAAQREQDRKDRTRRLCKRMGLIESMLPETIALTDEQFQTFLEKAVANEYGRSTLARIAAVGGGMTAPIRASAAAQTNAAPTVKSADTTQTNGTGGSANEGNGARVAG